MTTYRAKLQVTRYLKLLLRISKETQDNSRLLWLELCLASSYHGTAMEGLHIFRYCCPQSKGWASHNGYYHISTRLHLSKITLLPSRAREEHQRRLCDSEFLSAAEHYILWSFPLSQSPAPVVPAAIFNDEPRHPVC